MRLLDLQTVSTHQTINVCSIIYYVTYSFGSSTVIPTDNVVAKVASVVQ